MTNTTNNSYRVCFSHGLANADLDVARFANHADACDAAWSFKQSSGLTPAQRKSVYVCADTDAPNR